MIEYRGGTNADVLIRITKIITQGNGLMGFPIVIPRGAAGSSVLTTFNAAYTRMLNLRENVNKLPQKRGERAREKEMEEEDKIK